MFFELFLSLRYLKAKRKQAFISVITIISMIGVTVGVMSLVVVLSVINGFRDELTSKIMGVNAHVLVTDAGGALSDYREVGRLVNEVEGVVASTPFTYSHVMAAHDGNPSIAILRGVDTETAGKVLRISSMVREGNLEHLEDMDGRGPGVMVGNGLAAKIGASLGGSVTLLVPDGSGDGSEGQPVTGVYRVVALFESGMYDYDSSLVFLPLAEAQNLLGADGRVTGLEVRVVDPRKSDLVAERIRLRLGYPYSALDWKIMHRNLFHMLSIQKAVIGVILAMIVMVGVLSIVGTLILAVMEKTRDIGILRAMGASARRIMMLFVMQGLIVGAAGTISGIGLGLGICGLLEKYRFIDLPADVYWLSSLSVRVVPTEIALVALGALGLSFLATLYPSWRASSQRPADAVRYE
jgi:lipoprotein-releasing system permease protein